MAGEEQDEIARDDAIPTGFRLSEDQLRILREKWNAPREQLQAVEEAKPIDVEELQQPQPVIKDELIKERLIDLLDQRNEQRKKVFSLAKWYCWTSLILLIAIIFVQIAGRVAGPDLHFSVFDSNELQVLVIGVFGQFVGLLYIITKSLYDDKNYKDLFKDSVRK